MKINTLSKVDFLNLVYTKKNSFLDKLNIPEAYIVKSFYSEAEVISLRNKCFEWGLKMKDEWHPLKDGCPDYHRLHDNYPKAHVKQKFHAFYHHGYEIKNRELFNQFKDIFELKNYLADKEYSINEIPSSGVIARLNVHHYPVGGGYQMEHIDPAMDFARIQTLICASTKGNDYYSGGVYGRMEHNGEKYYLDDLLKPGDLLVISPDIHHGVHPIDDEVNYLWRTNSGRWMILPIFVRSDYDWKDNIKPLEVKN